MLHEFDVLANNHGAPHRSLVFCVKIYFVAWVPRSGTQVFLAQTSPGSAALHPDYVLISLSQRVHLSPEHSLEF
ncbi:hypothetical protein DLD14_08725 [Legionella anisa]|nr:hypothetical protein DLD14_08725 [Legionella anisa]